MKWKRGWHFVASDRRLGYGDNRYVRKGAVHTVMGPVRLCNHGLHASRRLMDALSYAPGPVVCRVRLGGEIVYSDDKAVAMRREVLWTLDATNILHEFACILAGDALRRAGVTDERSWTAIKVKRAWVAGKATDDELAAARLAAWNAAWDAVWGEVKEAAWGAVEATGKNGAWGRWWGAGIPAVWGAASPANNRLLTRMVKESQK